jgi:hypothetical protein
MSTATVTAALDAALVIDNSPLLKALVQQIRANDSYGTFRNWADELLLKPYVISKKIAARFP